MYFALRPFVYLHTHRHSYRRFVRTWWTFESSPTANILSQNLINSWRKRYRQHLWPHRNCRRRRVQQRATIAAAALCRQQLLRRQFTTCPPVLHPPVVSQIQLPPHLLITMSLRRGVWTQSQSKKRSKEVAISWVWSMVLQVFSAN